jgi:hypothetical protein
MKKIIKILQTNVEPLLIVDEDDSELNEYIQNLSNLLSVGHVTILETSSSSHIVRPQKIISISVTEEGTRKRKYTKKKDIKEEPKEISIETKIHEDIITDG